MGDKELFVEELKALLNKYNAHIEKDTDYNGYEEACGDNFTVIGGSGWTFDLDTIAS